MNRKEWYESYRQARYITRALVDIKLGSNAVSDKPLPPGAYCDVVEGYLGSVVCNVMMNRHKRTPYNIQKNKWAIKHNHRF